MYIKDNVCRYRFFTVSREVLSGFLFFHLLLFTSFANAEVYKNTEKFVPVKKGAQEVTQKIKIGDTVTVIPDFDPDDTKGNKKSTEKDKCSGNQQGVALDVNGCPQISGEPDKDNDGVNDQDDNCKGTPTGLTVDQQGCPENNLLVLSPKPQDVLAVKDKNARLIVTVDVRVIASKKDLRSVDVAYYGTAGIQADAINIPKGGGTGKGSVLVEVKGLDNYTDDIPVQLVVTAVFESGPSITEYIDLKVRLKRPSPNLPALKTLHQLQKQAIATIKQKEKQAQNKSTVPPQAIQELEKEFKEVEKQIEEFKAMDLSVTSSDQKKIIEEIKKDNTKFTNELKKLKEGLQPMMDQAKQLLDPVVEVLKWIDLEGKTTVSTKENEFKLIESINSVQKAIFSAGTSAELEIREDDQQMRVKITNGDFLFLKNMLVGGTTNPLIHDMVHEAVATAEYWITGEHGITADRREGRIFISNGKHTEITSKNTAYELSVEPVSGLDVIKVLHGPVNVRAINGQFENQVLESGTVMVIDKDGVVSKQQKSSDQLALDFKKYEAVLGGVNPAQLTYNGRPNADFNVLNTDLEGYEYANGIDKTIVSTSSDVDGDTLQHVWFIDGEYIEQLNDRTDWVFSLPESGKSSIVLHQPL